MPNRSNDDGLHDRMARIENKLDKQSEAIQGVDKNLVTTSTRLDAHTGDIARIDVNLKELGKLVEEKTSEARTVTWTQLTGVTKLLVFVSASILSLLMTAVYAWFLPQRIEGVIMPNGKLNQHFASLINASIDERLKSNNDTLKDSIEQSTKNIVEQSTNKIVDQLSALKAAVGTTVTRKGIRQKLNHALGTRKTSNNNLAEIQDLMSAVEMLKTPLERQDFKDLSVRLYNQYRAASDSERKDELLATFIKGANAKSVSEPALHKIPEAEIEKAKRERNYFEGTVDLSSRPNWEGAIFDKCTIIVSKPDVGVILTNVRFIDCNFDAVPESAPIRDLLSTYLETTRPTLTFPGYRVLKSYSIGRPFSPSNPSQ